MLKLMLFLVVTFRLHQRNRAPRDRRTPVARNASGVSPRPLTLASGCFASFFSTFKASNVPTSFVLSSVFSIPCALFCTLQNLNSFVFKQFQTLLQKHPGW